MSLKRIIVQNQEDASNVFAVLVIPSSLLWKAQRNWRRKLAPGGVLFFILFVIAFAIVRATVATVSQAHADEIQLYLWSNLEFAMGTFLPHFQILGSSSTQISCNSLMFSCTAITAACISPFRKLIKRWDRGPAQARPVVDRITTYLRSTLDRMRKRNKTASNFSDGIGLVDIEPSTGRSFASLGSSFTDPNVPLG